MNANCIDVLGKRFYKLLVISYYKKSKYGALWKCKCDCGKETITSGINLRRGLTKSCGCLKKQSHQSPNFIDLNGKRFGKLVVVERLPNDKFGFARWKCKCDCGKEKDIAGQSLRKKVSTSCGCLRKEFHRNPPFQTIYTIMTRAAKRTGRECTLSFKDYLEFTKINNCHYCKERIEWTPYRRRDQKSYMGYSLDRKDNSLGYTKENCVVCCPICNHIKGKMLTCEEMLKIGPLIGEIRKTRELHSPGQKNLQD